LGINLLFSTIGRSPYKRSFSETLDSMGYRLTAGRFFLRGSPHTSIGKHSLLPCNKEVKLKMEDTINRP
jgi:hypothetical protein